MKLDAYGKIIDVEKIEPDPQGAGNVGQAATEAAKQIFTVKFRVTWCSVMGIAGRKSQKDTLATTLY